MMSIGDSMLNHAGRLDDIAAQARSPAMATPIACGSIMINNTGIIQANRTKPLLISINRLQQKRCHGPRRSILKKHNILIILTIFYLTLTNVSSKMNKWKKNPLI